MSKKVFEIPQPPRAAANGEAWIGAERSPTKNLIVPMSAELHFKLKAHCLNRQINMSELVRKLLSRELASTATNK